MSSFYLLRHCDYENPLGILPGRLPVELSKAGKQEALRLQKLFAAKNISKIYSSAVLRCKQTAETISNGVIPTIYDKRLLETLSAYQGFWDEGKGDWSHFFGHKDELGGESYEDIKSRVADFWNEVRSRDEGNVIICSHGDPIQILYSVVKGLPLASEDISVEKIPGWIEKGEFLEITMGS